MRIAGVGIACIVLAMTVTAGGTYAAPDPEGPAAASETTDVPESLLKTWTVKKWKHFPPFAKPSEHMLVEESFEIVEVDGKPVVRPLGALKERWGIEEKELEVHDEYLCLRLSLSHYGKNKGHVVAFYHERDADNAPNPHGLDIRFDHRTLVRSCKNIPIHGGVAHAED